MATHYKVPYEDTQVLVQSHGLFLNICIFSSSASYLYLTQIVFYHLHIVYTVSTETLLFLFFNEFAPWRLEITYLDHFLVHGFLSVTQTPHCPSQLSQILQNIVPRCSAKRYHQCSFHLLLLKSHILLGHDETEQLTVLISELFQKVIKVVALKTSFSIIYLYVITFPIFICFVAAFRC